MARFSPALTFATGVTDIYEGINVVRMREERAEKARQEMKRQGIPAMVVTGEPNVRYLTGFSWGEFQPFLSYTLFFAEHDPIVFAHAGSYQQMQAEQPWTKHWRIARSTCQDCCGPEAAAEEYGLFAKEIRSELEERGLAKEKLGIIGFEQTARDSLRKEGLTVVETWPLLQEVGKCKTKDEVNCLKIAASFCTVGWQKFIEVCRPGMTTREVHRVVCDAILAAGADNAGGAPISGPFTFERNITRHNRRIEYGEMLYYPLCGTSFLGYTACLYRCFKMGSKPTDKEKDWYKRVRDTLEAAVEATRVGNTTADAAKCYPPASKWGYKDEVEVLTVEWGHGIGLVSLAPASVHYNLPAVNRQWSLEDPQPFEKGMVVAHESCEGEHRVGGARLEYMVEITENGPERLDFFPDEEIIVVGA